MSSSEGKVVGAFLGGLIGGPWGALLGGVVGALFDDSSTPQSLPPPRQPPRHPASRPANNHAPRPRPRPAQPNSPRQPTPMEVELEGYLRVLGLSPGVTMETVKKRYRVLARELHPDAFHARGLDPQSVLRAQETFKQVSAAYQNLNRLMR
jgi:hypothetical protein